MSDIIFILHSEKKLLIYASKSKQLHMQKHFHYHGLWKKIQRKSFRSKRILFLNSENSDTKTKIQRFLEKQKKKQIQLQFT